MADDNENVEEANAEQTAKRKKRRRKKKVQEGEEAVVEEEIKAEGEGEEEEYEEEMEEEKKEEEEAVGEETILTMYDPDDFISGAVTTLDSSFPEDLFEFQYSFGYDCHKYFNLCACDESVVCWATGSYITFFDVITKQVWYRRSSTGGTVGSLTSYRKDPNYRIAIAENREADKEPVIILYLWPQMEMDAVLRDGTSNAYSILDFSPDGEYLASVGKEPDYNLTIWNWKRHRIMLRTSAFSYGVNAVMFSPYCPGQLTTAGLAHIKFWKMAETFTGLKLKGDLGRFGKTEICDVLGVYPMPDEKVLSGCEWGNVLVWEAGLVKIEVTRKGRKTCHAAPVIQFMLNTTNFEVTTIARDGCIRVWYWDTVEQADPPEDDPYIEINPVAETCVPGCQIMTLRQQKGFDWYAQDANGGIWIVDMEVDKLECNHRKVMTCHAGGIVSMIFMRTHPLLVTAGCDGSLQIYNIENQMLMAKYQFPAAITCMIYAPIDIDRTSRIIMVGFADGIMRTLYLNPDNIMEQTTTTYITAHSDLSVHNKDHTHSDIITMISLLKPHSNAISQITINEQRTLLVTCGEDSTIFMYEITLETPFVLTRLGFIDTPNNIAYMKWKPDEERVLLLCGQVGLVMEAVLPPIAARDYKEITTFKLEFESYKETLVKKRYMRHRPFPCEEDLASLDEEALKAREEAEREEKEDEEQEWLGEIELMESDSMLGTTIIWADYCEEGIWVVQKGTGALLLIVPGNNKILKYAPFPGSWCDDITSLQFLCDRRFLMVGTNRGYIKVVRMPEEDEDTPEHHFATWTRAMMKMMKLLKGRKLKKEEKQPIPRIDFEDYYYLPMHDYYTGAITKFEFSSDGKYLFSCGSDGNIFCYLINFEEPLLQQPVPPDRAEILPVKKVHEPSTLEGELMSHEQLKQKEEYDKMMAIANAHKKRVRDQLAELSIEYNKLIKANKLLPCSQQIDVTLDPRPLEVQEKELDDAKALTIRKLAHQLEASDLGLHKMYYRNIVQCDVYPFLLKAIRDPNTIIRPFRQKNLSQEFYDQLDEVYRKMAEAALKGRPPLDKLLEIEKPKHTESIVRRGAAKRTSWGPPRVASFLLGLPPRQPHPLKKAIRNYYQRLHRHHAQFIEWQEHLSRKPDPNAMPPGAAEALKEAEATIGNRVLKTHPDYVAPPGHNTQLRLCLTRQEIYENKRAFNEKVLELRQHKVYLVSRMKSIGERLNEIRAEIPPSSLKAPPLIPEIDDELEFPEKNLEIRPDPVVLGPKNPGRKGTICSDRKSSHPYPVPRVKQPRVPRFVPLIETKPLQVTWEFLKPKIDLPNTDIENEVRARRITRHLYEQDMLIGDAEKSIQKFDARLRQLQRERIRVQEKNQLLELHLCQLHREMDVLNRFEAHEDALAERVYDKLMQVRGVQEQIADCEQRIEDHKVEKERLDRACQDLQREFKRLVQDNKFADFLRRIFKKKYRPPRDHDDDEFESESESSSSSEEEEGSLDSRDIGPIRLDPNICPEGCEKDLYDKTFEMRNTRNKHEQEMIEQDKLVELLKKDIEAHNKVKKKLNLQLDKRKKGLKDFMLEKQSCMNVIDQVVVLRYSQCRAKAIYGCTGPEGLSQTVVFPELVLMRLRKRVLELQEEIRLQKLRAKINRTHLHRMLIDIRYMQQMEKELRAKMRDILTKKLGKPRKVDKTLDDVLRQMARRHKFYASLSPVRQVMKQVKEWQRRYSDLEKEYMKLLHSSADRIRMAAALQNDALSKENLEVHPMPGHYQIEDYERDVIRLQILRSQQNHQIKAIRDEIQNMRLKASSGATVMPADHLEEWTETSRISLIPVRRKIYRPLKKFFPITPLGSQVNVVRNVKTVEQLFDCLDAMRVTRDDADKFLNDLTQQIPLVLSGVKTRYDAVEDVMKKWLSKSGGDPTAYKKQTKVFDAIALLFNQLVAEQAAVVETPKDDQDAMRALEQALRTVSGTTEPLQNRLGPVLAALFLTGDTSDIKTAEAMTSVIKSLVDTDHPLKSTSIDKIVIAKVVSDIKDRGVTIPDEEIIEVVNLAVDCLKAQIITQDEREAIDREVDQALTMHKPLASSVGSATQRSVTSVATKSMKSTKGSKVSRRSSKQKSRDLGDLEGVDEEQLVDWWISEEVDKAEDELFPTTQTEDTLPQQQETTAISQKDDTVKQLDDSEQKSIKQEDISVEHDKIAVEDKVGEGDTQKNIDEAQTPKVETEDTAGEIVADTGDEIVADTGDEIVADIGDEIVADIGDENNADTGNENVVDTEVENVADTGNEIVADTGDEINADTEDEKVADTGDENVADEEKE